MSSVSHDARAPLEIVPEPGMIFCRLGATHTKPGAVFGPTAIELFRVAAVSRSAVAMECIDRPSIIEQHALAGGVLRLASAPNKISFTYVADSLSEMRKRFT